MQVEANRGRIEELDVQALAVAVFKDEKPGEGILKRLDELSGGRIVENVGPNTFRAVDDDGVGVLQRFLRQT